MELNDLTFNKALLLAALFGNRTNSLVDLLILVLTAVVLNILYSYVDSL